MTATEVVRAWFDGLNEGLPFHLSQDDIEIGNLKEFVVQGTYHGHEGMQRWFDDAFDVLGDSSFKLAEMIDGGDGEHVVTVQRALGTSAHTGLEFDLEWAAVWTVRDEKVARVQGYATKAQALKAAGIAEEEE